MGGVRSLASHVCSQSQIFAALNGFHWTFMNVLTISIFESQYLHIHPPESLPLPLPSSAWLQFIGCAVNQNKSYIGFSMETIPSHPLSYRWESVSRIGRKPLRENYSYAEWTAAGKYRDLSRIYFWVQYLPLFFMFFALDPTMYSIGRHSLSS